MPLFEKILCINGLGYILAVKSGYEEGCKRGAIDSLTGIVYRHPDRRPASVWELMHNPELVIRHSKAGSIAYARPGQFRAAAISNYSVCDWRGYDYTASRLNDYYRSVLKMAEQGWPGGLRWLHGEDT